MELHPEATVVVRGWPSLIQGSLPNSSRRLPPFDKDTAVSRPDFCQTSKGFLPQGLQG